MQIHYILTIYVFHQISYIIQLFVEQRLAVPTFCKKGGLGRVVFNTWHFGGSILAKANRQRWQMKLTREIEHCRSPGKTCKHGHGEAKMQGSQNRTKRAILASLLNLLSWKEVVSGIAEAQQGGRALSETNVLWSFSRLARRYLWCSCSFSPACQPSNQWGRDLSLLLFCNSTFQQDWKQWAWQADKTQTYSLHSAQETRHFPKLDTKITIWGWIPNASQDA